MKFGILSIIEVEVLGSIIKANKEEVIKVVVQPDVAIGKELHGFKSVQVKEVSLGHIEVEFFNRCKHKRGFGGEGLINGIKGDFHWLASQCERTTGKRVSGMAAREEVIFSFFWVLDLNGKDSSFNIKSGM